MAEQKRTLRRAGLLTVAVLVGLGLLAGRTVFSRISNAKTLEAQVAERNKSYVRVTQPASGAEAQTVVLPGTLQGYVQAPISARASGSARASRRSRPRSKPARRAFARC